ncbi:response regulator transcription factor [Pontibacter sp. G13]|uniref:response regulator transcription factor n=1 Tax=Pontibacter sp. G13 TaxID=3074898 RepID=UPI00288A6C0F|nr:response regulator transcription factor [Pontibacter sp. G13]WNJ20184.1 response regulator transcription factor [Pontibacter sp. G13]
MDMTPHILIIEDEPSMSMGLRDNLEFEGYRVETAMDGRQGWEKAQAGTFDLILLDIMLPQMSGYEVCKLIRGAGMEVPVIMLSAKGEEIDKVLGLELGADDYLTKPFGLRELLARVKAVLRRVQPVSSGASSDERVQIGRLSVEFSKFQAWEADQEIRMSHKEFEILQFLWQHRNEPVSRDQLLEGVWGYAEAPTTRTVDNFMLKLRQKIEQDSRDPRMILTVHGIGYKLVVA